MATIPRTAIIAGAGIAGTIAPGVPALPMIGHGGHKLIEDQPPTTSPLKRSGPSQRRKRQPEACQERPAAFSTPGRASPSTGGRAGSGADRFSTGRARVFQDYPTD